MRATLGNFWSFPHTLLYSEPPRLAALDLVTETRETRRSTASPLRHHAGRRGRLERLARPTFQLVARSCATSGSFSSSSPTSPRPKRRLRLAEQQLAIHRAKLAAYEEDARLEGRPTRSGRGDRTVEHWRGETLSMGLLYEGAAVDFWTAVAAKARAATDATEASVP